MLLSEPPRSAYDLNFSLFGISVRVHPLFWGVALLLGLNGNPRPAEMMLWIGTVFVSILVHEMGHALAALAHGWQPHITLYGMGGLASYQPTYRSAQSQILITAAGPAAGFLFAAAIVAVIAATGHQVTFDWTFQSLLPIRWEPYGAMQTNFLLADLLYINIFWGLVNLLPVYPLDGGQISREVLGLINPRDAERQSLWLSVIGAAVVAILAVTKLHDQYIAIFFAYLGYMSYRSLQSTFGAGGGMGGFR